MQGFTLMRTIQMLIMVMFDNLSRHIDFFHPNTTAYEEDQGGSKVILLSCFLFQLGWILMEARSVTTRQRATYLATINFFVLFGKN